MKIILTVIAGVLLTGTYVFSQIKPEGVLEGKYKVFSLEDGSLKYLRYKPEIKQLLIYNVDKTLWKKVTLPLPEGHILDDVKLISEKVFYKDPQIEIAYSCAVYNLPKSREVYDENFEKINFTLNIINEKGETLLKIEDSNEMEIVETESGKKLIIYKHIGKGFDSVNKTLVYSLP